MRKFIGKFLYIERVSTDAGINGICKGCFYSGHNCSDIKCVVDDKDGIMVVNWFMTVVYWVLFIFCLKGIWGSRRFNN